jgi:poly(A) polymerase
MEANVAEAQPEATPAETGEDKPSFPLKVDSPKNRRVDDSTPGESVQGPSGSFNSEANGASKEPTGLELMEQILRDDEERPKTQKHSFPSEDLDEDAIKIVRRLQHHGHAAFLVGGCVRDLMAGQHPKDFDVATSATPRQIKRLFRNCRIIGRRFKLVHIFFRDGKIIELATFRATPSQDEKEELLITDDNVFGTPREDAFRRDFTINALLFDPDTEMVIDFVGGLSDMEQGRIRSIGDPEIRFQEDPVRILRALKFAARLDYEIDRADKQAISKHRSDLLKSPMARLLEEIHKILGCGASAFTFQGLKLTGVLQAVLPGLDKLLLPPSEGSGLFWKMLETLDVTSGGKRIFSNPIMLSVVIFPLYLEAAEKANGGNFGHLSRWLGEFFRSCDLLQQIPRKDKGRIRQIISSLWRFSRPADAPPFSIAAFVRREYFLDAYRFWKLIVAATGSGAEQVAFWNKQVASLAAEEREQGSRLSSGGAFMGSPRSDQKPETREDRQKELPPPDPEPNYRQPHRGANRPKAVGFGATRAPSNPRGNYPKGFGMESRKQTQPLGFGDGIVGNTQIRLSQLGFGEEVDLQPVRTLSAAGGVGFGADALFVGRSQKKKPKKKLPVIPGINTPDILGGRRKKANKKRRKGKGGSGGSGSRNAFQSQGSGSSSGQSKSGRRRRRRRR